MIPKILASLLLLTGTPHAAPVFIGTNTGGGSDSKGIYLADFDSATGRLSQPKLVVEYSNPGFLALHPRLPVLYAVGQPARPLPNGTSSVAAFAIGEDHSLKLLGEASTGGKGACHLAVDAKGRTVAIANYGDGHISTVRLDEKGIPGEAVTVIANKGSGPNKSRQEGPHAHGVYFDQANKLLLVPDLGLDKVFVYPFDSGTSKLGDALPPLTCVPGSGPRHMAFSPDRRNVYVIGELDASVLAVDNGKDRFPMLGSVSTLPADFTGANKAAEIEVHPNGKFLYASNRGHDTIAVYRRNPETGALTFLQHAPCGGKVPRHFKIDRSGKWLLCAHQDSDDISVLPLDPRTGLLGKPGSTVPSPSPICLLFAR